MKAQTSYVQEIEEMRKHGKVKTVTGEVVEVGFFDPEHQPPPPHITWGLFIKGEHIMVGDHVRPSGGDAWSFERTTFVKVAKDWRDTCQNKDKDRKS